MHIALLEDEPAWRDAVIRCISSTGWTVTSYSEPSMLLQDIERRAIDIIILGVHLDGEPLLGTEPIRPIRLLGKTMPILVLTQFAERHGAASVLDGGADDYLAKPFNHEELRARLNALSRRTVDRDNTVLVVGPLTISGKYRTTCWYERPVELRGQGFDVLQCLAHARGDVVSHTMLWREVWQRWANIPPQLQPIQAAIHRLRKDFAHVTTQTIIGTAPGLGYRLVMP